MIGRNLLTHTKKHPLKIDFKCILFRKLVFGRFMHSLFENENTYVRKAYCATKEVAFRLTRIVT